MSKKKWVVCIQTLVEVDAPTSDEAMGKVKGEFTNRLFEVVLKDDTFDVSLDYVDVEENY